MTDMETLSYTSNIQWQYTIQGIRHTINKRKQVTRCRYAALYSYKNTCTANLL